MIVRILIIAFLAYLVWRFVRRDLMRKFGPIFQQPLRDTSTQHAVETVQCPHCGVYIPTDMKCACKIGAS